MGISMHREAVKMSIYKLKDVFFFQLENWF